MTSLKQYFNRRLTGRETVVVVVTALTLAGLGYVAYNLVAAQILEARVKAAMPQVCAAIREQRRILLSALEAYKAHFGVYPPDHVVGRQPLVIDPVNNPLLYELVGVIYNSTIKTLELGNLEPADAKFVKEFFHCDGFKNCARSNDQVKRFLTTDPLPARQLHDDPDVFVLGFNVPCEGLAPEVVWAFTVSSWRYVSTSPTHNPGQFDLWIEVKTRSQSVTLGNWQAAD